MSPTTHAAKPTSDIDPNSECVARFERDLREEAVPDLRTYLPASSAPDYIPTLVELIRVDIESRWNRGVPKQVEEYLAEYPELLVADALADLAFEDYRARLHAEGPMRIDASEPADLLATMRQPVRLFTREPFSLPELPQLEFNSGTENPKGVAALPAVGETFLGFRLFEELGRGAFGRVYLAHQGDLGGRSVALKIGTGLFSESQTLAQLQHTNIVPIYSLHQSKRLQAVCMPFFGRTTLAHVLSAIRGQAVFPSSGQALLSTLHPHPTSTTPERPSTASHDESTFPPGVIQAVPTETDPVSKSLLSRLSYPDAVVWVGAQLAAGLAHAHERGIVHRDLKPANILLTDDGVPMILDFNLAEDIKLRHQFGKAAVGGTIPYMSPEQLKLFDNRAETVDAQSDVYALGVVLFELLTGRRPFDDMFRGSRRDGVRRMIAAREARAPSPRAVNPAVSHGVDAILRKCLAPDRANRYHSARDLQEDLHRHLKHQPLRHVRLRSWRERAKKWAARHPRLSSSSTVAVVGLAIVAALTVSAAYARERDRSYRAAEDFRAHAEDFRNLQTFLDDRNRSLPALGEGLTKCRSVLGRYGVPEDGGDNDWHREVRVRYLPGSEQQSLREDVGEVFYLMARVSYQQAVVSADPVARAEHAARAAAWNTRAADFAGDRIPRALIEQRAELARLSRDPAEWDIRTRAAATPPAAARDYFLMGCWFAQLGKHREALPFLRKATQSDPEHFSAWFVRGTSHLALEQNELAALCFGSCVALDKRFAPAWLNRGLAYSRLRFFDQACDDYDQALRLDPALTEAHLQRARAKEARGDLEGAIADLTSALESGAAPSRVYFFRAHLRERLGSRSGAAADRAEGLKRIPSDALSWVARAEYRLDTPNVALDDVEQALRINPACADAMQLKAHILSERLGRGADAIPVLDRAVELYPDFVPARAGRGVLLARAGKRTAAIRDAEEALLRDTKGPNLYQVACIYALTSRQEPADRVKGLELLRSGLRTGFGLDLVDTDADLDPIRKDPAFDRIVAEARAIHASR